MKLPARHAALALVLMAAAAIVTIKSERWRLEGHRLSKASAQITGLQSALERYRSDHGYYRLLSRAVGIGRILQSDGVVEGRDAAQPDPGMVIPPLPQVGPHPTDPWGRPFCIRANSNEYLLGSDGPTGRFNPDDFLTPRSPSGVSE